MATNYKQQAQKEYDVYHNERVNGLKNQLAQNQLTLEQQKGGINANYDTQVGSQNLANRKSKNNISNTMLGRGLANSSIVTSGLAEADQINNRIVGQINSSRTGDLNNIDSQKSLLAQNMQGTLSGMSADRLSAIESLARQLEDRQWDKDFKDKGFNLQQENSRADQSYKNSSLAMQREQMLAEQSYKNASLAQQRELANSQMAWDREQFNAKNSPNNDAYNAYLAGISEIRGARGVKEYDKKMALASLADEMSMYQKRNGVDLNDLIQTSNKFSSSANGITRVNGTGISRSTR